MIDDLAKSHLHGRLREARSTFVAKLDRLNDYDVRRPMSQTGTNLLGLVKHLAVYEAAYFGAVFARPLAEQPLPANDGRFRNRDHMHVAAHESRADVVAAYARACQHADATIESLTLDAIGHVGWWDDDVTLFVVLVHMLTETHRHLGHADLIREALDGAVGDSPEPPTVDQLADRAAHRDMVETAASRWR